MNLNFINARLSDPKLLQKLSTLVEDPEALIPQSENEFSQLA